MGICMEAAHVLQQGKSREEIREEEKAAWEEMSISQHMEVYEKQGIARKEAMKLVAKDRGVTKREIYQALLEIKQKNYRKHVKKGVFLTDIR